MEDFGKSEYVKQICAITAQSYQNGWDERNGGNVSYRILSDELTPFYNVREVKRVFKLGFDAHELAGRYYLVTGTGRYFKNVSIHPERELGLVRITKDGLSAELMWGYEDGAQPTSEFPSHLMTHIVRQKVDPNARVVMHCHPTNLIALSFTQELDERKLSQLLWRMQAESMVVFPEGVGIIPYMTPGTTDIGEATAKKMNEFRLVMWPHHGVFACANDPDETFGLIETVEKAAQIYSVIMQQGGKIRQQITDKDLQELAGKFNVEPNKNLFN